MPYLQAVSQLSQSGGDTVRHVGYMDVASGRSLLVAKCVPVPEALQYPRGSNMMFYASFWELSHFRRAES